MGGSRGGWGWGVGGGEKGVLFLQANLSSISLPTPRLNLSSLSGVVCSGTRFALRLLYTLLLLRIVPNRSFFFFFFFLPLLFKERSDLFPPVKSSANWFLPRLKRALIRVMPNGVKKIFTAV